VKLVWFLEGFLKGSLAKDEKGIEKTNFGEIS
jgi:hypothetical protein